MKKRVVVLATAMTAAMIFGTTAMAEEGGLSGKFSLFHFERRMEEEPPKHSGTQ
ncbi:MAG: hypothetical protein ACLTSZ_13030 [Lachnospiraceae bacterium]